MPAERPNRAHKGEDIAARHRLPRLIKELSDEPEVEASFCPTFDYARAPAHFQRFNVVAALLYPARPPYRRLRPAARP